MDHPIAIEPNPKRVRVLFDLPAVLADRFLPLVEQWVISKPPRHPVPGVGVGRQLHLVEQVGQGD